MKKTPQRACVIDVLSQRNKDFIIKYMQEKFGESFLQQITVFSCDMWDGFISVAKERMPNAVIVVDRFHVSNHINTALDRCRKSLRKEFPDEVRLKYLRWALLKHPDKLYDDEKQLLEKAFKCSPELEKVYQLKEEFRAIFDEMLERDEGENRLNAWIEKAEALNNVYVKLFLKTLKNYKEYILNFFINRVSNGIVEGINNRVKFLKRQG
ncbi:MAG: ISL3 family transposase, partial [Gemmatimonadetes bacterium]